MDTSKQSYRKQYYTENKERILDGMYRKVHCEACNCDVLFCNRTKHNRSKKHRLNVYENAARTS